MCFLPQGISHCPINSFCFFNAQVIGEKTKAQRAYIFSLGSQSDSNQGNSCWNKEGRK